MKWFKKTPIEDMIKDKPAVLSGRSTPPKNQLVKDYFRSPFLVWASIIIICASLGFYFWRKLVSPSEIQTEIIESPTLPLKTEPEDPQGLKIPHQDKLVLEDPNNQETALSDLTFVEEIEDDSFQIQEVIEEAMATPEETTRPMLPQNTEPVPFELPAWTDEEKPAQKDIDERPSVTHIIVGKNRKGHLALQAGSFKNFEHAEKEAKRLRAFFDDSRIGGAGLMVEELKSHQTFPYRVVVGPYSSHDDLTNAKRYLKQKRVDSFSINWKQ